MGESFTKLKRMQESPPDVSLLSMDSVEAQEQPIVSEDNSSSDSGSESEGQATGNETVQGSDATSSEPEVKKKKRGRSVLCSACKEKIPPLEPADSKPEKKRKRKHTWTDKNRESFAKCQEAKRAKLEADKKAKAEAKQKEQEEKKVDELLTLE